MPADNLQDQEAPYSFGKGSSNGGIDGQRSLSVSPRPLVMMDPQPRHRSLGIVHYNLHLCLHSVAIHMIDSVTQSHLFFGFLNCFVNYAGVEFDCTGPILSGESMIPPNSKSCCSSFLLHHCIDDLFGL